MDTPGYQEQMINLQYVLSVKTHIGIKRGDPMLQIDYNLVTVQDAIYLLSNYNGYMDADKQCLIIK